MSGGGAILRASVTHKLDAVGEFKVELPLTDPRAAAVQRGRIWRHYREGEGLVFAGIIDDIRKTPEGRLSFTGQTLLGELLYLNTLTKREYSNASINSVMDSLLTRTGWSRNGSVTTTILARFDGESILRALLEAVTRQGVHIRENVTEVAGALVRQVDLGTMGASSNVTIMNGQPDPLLVDDPALAYAEDFVIDEVGQEVWNWLQPLGFGTGTTQLSLRYSTRTLGGGDPYAILKTRGIPRSDDNVIYFLADYTVWDGAERGLAVGASQAITSADTGQAWAEDIGTWLEVSDAQDGGIIRINALVGGEGLVTLASGVADCVVGAIVIDNKANGSGLVFRASDADNFWVAELTATGIDLIKEVATVQSTVAQYTGGTVVDGDSLDVVLSGSSIRVFINRVEVINAEDSFNASATRCGLRAETTVPRTEWTSFYVAGALTSIAQYGVRQRPLVAKDIQALSTAPASTALQVAADSLYDLAAANLAWLLQAPIQYSFNARGLAASVKVGDKVRLRWRGVARHHDNTEAYIDVDAEFFVLQRTREFLGDGSEFSKLVISDVDRFALTGNDVLLGTLFDSSASFKTHVQLSVSNRTAGPYLEELGPGAPPPSAREAIMTLYIPNNVQQLLRCIVRLRPRTIRSPVDVTDSEPVATSDTESAHTHTVTIPSHTHAVTGEATDGGGSSTPTSASDVGDHKHDVGQVQDDKAAWVNPTDKRTLTLYRTPSTGVPMVIGENVSLPSGVIQLQTQGAQDATHTHVVTIAAHTHTLNTVVTDADGDTVPTSSGGVGHSHTVPAHDHAIVFGIFESTTATAIRIFINGTDRTAALGGPWNAVVDFDITTYLTDANGVVVQGDHEVKFQSTTLGRVEVCYELVEAVSAIVTSGGQGV